MGETEAQSIGAPQPLKSSDPPRKELGPNLGFQTPISVPL